MTLCWNKSTYYSLLL